MAGLRLLAAGGVTAGVWSPLDGVEHQTTLLLGETVTGWQTDPSWPVGLTDRDHDVITVSTPNWGNGTDQAAITNALNQAAAAGVDTSRLLVVARRAGAVAALNFVVRNYERVSHVLLVSPIIDLAERWTRVTADRTSLQAAYGGSQATFDAAMPAWNPAHVTHRRFQVEDFVGDRLTIWWAADDAMTPAATTAALATAFSAATGTLATANPSAAPVAAVLEPAAVADWSWRGSRAATEMRRWQTFQAATSAFRASDGSVSCVLPDGRTVWSWADTLGLGSVDADGTWGSGVTIVARNSLVVQAANGTITGKFFPAGGTGPALPGPAGEYYWSQGVVVDRGRLIVSSAHRTNAPPPFGTAVDSHLYALALPGLTVDEGPVAVPFGDIVDGEENIVTWGYRYEPDGAWVYDCGIGSTDGDAVSCISRVRAGQVMTPVREVWTGSRWEVGGAARPQSYNGEVVSGWGAVTKIRQGVWIFYAKDLIEPTMPVFVGPSPAGPWRPWATVPTPESGQTRYGGTAFSYAPQAHMQLSDDDTVVLTWHTALDQPTEPQTNMAATVVVFRSIPRP